jgi:hypothetical protein
MVKRVLIAVILAYLVAAYASEFVFFAVLSNQYGGSDGDGPKIGLIVYAPVFVPIRFTVVAMGTLFGGRETFGQKEFRVPFATFLLVFSGVYVAVRCIQDQRRHASA